jgi:hypothetical protein
MTNMIVQTDRQTDRQRQTGPCAVLRTIITVLAAYVCMYLAVIILLYAPTIPRSAALEHKGGEPTTLSHVTRYVTK